MLYSFKYSATSIWITLSIILEMNGSKEVECNGSK